MERCPNDGSPTVPRPGAGHSVEVDGSLAVAVASLPPETLPEGAVVGDYQIEQVIGVGGMGVVYAACHPLIGKRAAIKVLNARYCADREDVSRFIREAQVVNQIGHANIVDIFAFGQLPDGRSYLIMERLLGDTLAALVTRGRCTVTLAISILVPLTRALDAAHAAGVIHRDLKPENVILVPEDESFRVKLLDFGIAKLSSAPVSNSRTATGMTVGTPRFMSPEQARGLAADAPSDAYSLGVLAYFMVTGRTPFQDEQSPVEILNAHISKTPVPPSAFVPDLPAAYDALVMSLLAKRAEDRPSLSEVRARLNAIMPAQFAVHTDPRGIPLAWDSGTSRVMHASTGSGQHAGLPDRVPASQRPRRRRWLLAGGLAAATITATILLVTHSSRGNTAPSRGGTPAAADAATQLRVEGALAEPPPTAPPPGPATGTAELEIVPEFAAVAIDGNRVTLEHGAATLDLPPGNYALTVTAPGYLPLSNNLTISANDATIFQLKLKPRPRPRSVTEPHSSSDPDAVVNPFSKKRPK